MSASVATSAVGLLDRHFSPVSAHSGSDVQGWSDAMEVDRPKSEGLSRNVEDEAKPNNEHIRNGNDAQINTDRTDALGGLLAALATKSTSKPVPPPIQTTTRRSVTPPEDSPISQVSQISTAEFIDRNGDYAEEEVATTPPNNACLLSAEPNNTAIAPAEDPDLELPLPITYPDQFDGVSFPQEDMTMPFPPLDLQMDQSLPTSSQEAVPLNVKRQIDAYARLEFADGTFYLNTFQCELGRDQHAYRDALQRDKEAKEIAELEKQQPKSSSGKASQRSHVIRTAGSQVQGSVGSEAGGFAGVDEQPVEAFGNNRDSQDGKQHSSQQSDSDIVKPAEVLHNPSLAPYDYHKDVVYQSSQLPVPENDIVEDERPAPVTSEHLPDPGSCPLIPIHTTIASDQTEAECLKAISRRHIRIFWNWQHSAFFMEVLGRNGAFFEDEHMKRGESVRLYSGARIQISAVEFTFRLPDTIADRPTEDSESEEGLEASPSAIAAASENGTPVKLKLRLNTDAANQAAGLNGELKRRGPGRPPKNGVMSQREMKEREKAEKEAKARAVHGIPPALPLERKPSQPVKAEPLPEALKSEKRKYTKRKREDGEEEDVLPSIEGQDEPQITQLQPPPPPQSQQPTAKRARTKSYSPEYKPFAECSPEDLARPPHNYAVLLYMVLSETGEITLRQIYKQMQARWPYFKYVVDSDGWTSSVRHNLNQEVGKLFERGRKEGKGFTWLPKPNAMEEYQAQKNKRSNAPPVPKPRPAAPQRPNYPPTQGQQITWQTNGAGPQSTGPNDKFVHQGPWPAQSGNQSKGVQSATSGSPYPPNTGRPAPGQSPGVIPSNPNYVPPAHQLPQYFGKPAPKFMPVTFEGLAVIQRFEQSMFQNLKQDEETQGKWRGIFNSVKGRCLHGATSSQLPGGESPEEQTIMKHVKEFVQRYKNPAFEGFNKAPRTASPAANGTVAPVAAPSGAAALPNGLQHGPPTPQPAPTATDVPANSTKATPTASNAANSVSNVGTGPTVPATAPQDGPEPGSTSSTPVVTLHSQLIPPVTLPKISAGAVAPPIPEPAHSRETSQTDSKAQPVPTTVANAIAEATTSLSDSSAAATPEARANAGISSAEKPLNPPTTIRDSKVIEEPITGKHVSEPASQLTPIVSQEPARELGKEEISDKN